MAAVASFRPVILAPTYNNAATVGIIVDQLLALDLPVLVVNDGSTDGTAEVLAPFCARILVVTHPTNQGKAAALTTGFAAAANAGYTHAVTMDTDGQLNPADIPRLLALASEWPGALVLGVRDEGKTDYPARSRLGRRFSNTMVRLECGLRVSDSQCGLRVYPLSRTRELHAAAQHYGFETEIITRWGWSRGEVREAPVACRYLPGDDRVSHFRPGMDSLRAVTMHLRLLTRAVLPWPHRMFDRLDKDGQPWRKGGTAWSRLARWLSPSRAWRELREQETAPRDLAFGLAVGVFIANLPLYGAQTLLALYAARRLRLNPLTVVAGSHISTPPVGPALIVAAVAVGQWLLPGAAFVMPAGDHAWRTSPHLVRSLLIDWSVGGVVVGSILATVVFFISHLLFRRVAIYRD